MERPILFNGDMVRAILEGRKMQTRRMVKPQPQFREAPGKDVAVWYPNGYDDSKSLFYASMVHFLREVAKDFCSIGQPGDRLWVKEEWAQDDYDIHAPVYFRSDYSKYSEAQIKELVPDGGWHRSIHMPRWASRITLEISDVRVQRLQEISEEDAVAEGMQKSACGLWCGSAHKAHGFPRQHNTAVKAFADIWDSIYSKRGTGWAVNPWVWAVRFECV